MEQKIYERQISKLSMAFRVVDEHQIDRHFNAKDQEILYEFDPKSEPKTTLNLPKVNSKKKNVSVIVSILIFAGLSDG